MFAGLYLPLSVFLYIFVYLRMSLALSGILNLPPAPYPSPSLYCCTTNYNRCVDLSTVPRLSLFPGRNTNPKSPTPQHLRRWMNYDAVASATIEGSFMSRLPSAVVSCAYGGRAGTGATYKIFFSSMQQVKAALVVTGTFFCLRTTMLCTMLRTSLISGVWRMMWVEEAGRKSCSCWRCSCSLLCLCLPFVAFGRKWLSFDDVGAVSAIFFYSCIFVRANQHSTFFPVQPVGKAINVRGGERGGDCVF